MAFLKSSTDNLFAILPVAGWWWNHTGWPGMNPSGKPITRAPLLPASSINRHAFATDPSRSRKTDAACTAATRTISYESPPIRMLLDTNLPDQWVCGPLRGAELRGGGPWAIRASFTQCLNVRGLSIIAARDVHSIAARLAFVAIFDPATKNLNLCKRHGHRTRWT